MIRFGCTRSLVAHRDRPEKAMSEALYHVLLVGVQITYFVDSVMPVWSRPVSIYLVDRIGMTHVVAVFYDDIIRSD